MRREEAMEDNPAAGPLPEGPQYSGLGPRNPGDRNLLSDHMCGVVGAAAQTTGLPFAAFPDLLAGSCMRGEQLELESALI